MQVLVVHAHPLADSYSAALRDAAVRALGERGHEVTVLDLYGEGFRAAMSLDERRAYHEDEPIIDDQVARHARAVATAEALVFVYPTWWSGPPAVLKGWLERVLVAGVAFRFDERTGKVRPAMRRVRHIVGITTYGSTRVQVAALGDAGRRTLLRAMRLSTGWRTRSRWLALYGMDTATDADRRAFLDRVHLQLGRL